MKMNWKEKVFMAVLFLGMFFLFTPLFVGWVESVGRFWGLAQ